jgi:hypothetical protein
MDYCRLILELAVKHSAITESTFSKTTHVSLWVKLSQYMYCDV